MPDRNSAPGSSGASQGLETAFRHFSGDLYRYVLRRLRRPEDAADLTQEIFERFMRGEGAAKVRNAQAYLFGIAANAVADARMARGQDPVTYDSDATSKLTEQLPASRPLPADELETEQELRAALLQLPPVHRMALLLTKWEGLSIQETAQRLNLTEGSVGVYVCEARAKLKNWLKHR